MTATRPAPPRRFEAALPFAWELPRFEPDEFVAAFVRANKRGAEDYARDFEAQAEKTDGDVKQKAWLLARAAEYRNNPIYRSCRGGGIRLVPFEGPDAYQRFASDIEYLYDIRCDDGKLRVTACKTAERDGVWTVEKFFEGTTASSSSRATPPPSCRG